MLSILTRRQGDPIVSMIGWVAGCGALLVAELHSCRALSRSVAFPVARAVKAADQQKTVDRIRTAFQNVVDSTDFFVTGSNHASDDASSCRVPLFGDNVTVAFSGPTLLLPGRNNDSCEFLYAYTLTVIGATNDDDFGWICAKFYESKDYFAGLLDTDALRLVVAQHFNQWHTPDPGHLASEATLAGSERLGALFADDRILKDLKRNGFVVLDVDAPKTTLRQHEMLSNYLVEKTNQGVQTRTDTVHFLTRKQASDCGLDEHFDLLMGIASHLNEHFPFEPTLPVPLAPATADRPLTIPRSIQVAEYAHGGYYKAHSDNSLSIDSVAAQGTRQRNNFRHFTCILYCNDDWTADDGGALRIYPGSRDLLYPKEAITTLQSVDIYPLNGRLVIFDSCLVHSVERVNHLTKVRRALTFWITRPDDSDVQGETYY
jgi:2OG-Fe(II) oxygenase superfamily